MGGQLARPGGVDAALVAGPRPAQVIHIRKRLRVSANATQNDTTA